MRPSRARAAWFVALAFTAALAGCGGYQSTYVAPQDGRGRIVWSGDSPVFVGPNTMPAGCLEAVDPSQLEEAFHPHGGGPYYIVHGPPVVFVNVPVRAVHPVPMTTHFHGPNLDLFTGSGGKSSGNGKGAEALIAVVAVAVIVALPFVALGLAVGNPEPSDDTSAAMDRANAFNDLTRQPNTPCSMPIAPAGATP